MPSFGHVWFDWSFDGGNQRSRAISYSASRLSYRYVFYVAEAAVVVAVQREVDWLINSYSLFIIISRLLWKMSICPRLEWNEYWNHPQHSLQDVFGRLLRILSIFGRSYCRCNGRNLAGTLKSLHPQEFFDYSSSSIPPTLCIVWSWPSCHQHHHQLFQHRVVQRWPR